MINTTLEFLWSTTPPWLHVGHGEFARKGWIPSVFYSRDGLNVCVRKLRGWKMRDRQSLMSEIGAALQFFDGFGENWYALEECLSYLDEWLPADAYVLVIEKAEEILVDDDDAFTDFLKSVNGAGEFWSRPVTSPDRFVRAAIPFHMLLNVSDSDAVSIERIARLAASADVGIDVTESGQYS